MTQAMSGRNYNLSRRANRGWAAARILAAALYLLTPVHGTQAQQASTPAPQSPTATTLVPVRQTKLRPANANDMALPVIAVVHRLSGWRLRAMLARPDAPLAASTFDDQFIRTNIVAGYVLPDGRSVVARLPRAEAEMLDLTAQFRGDGINAGPSSPALTLVRSDGSEVNARFVGLDVTTGLSLLEAEQPIAPPAPERVPQTPAVGQRVRVIAPVSIAAPVTTTAMTAPAARPEDAPTGDTGIIYMNMSEAVGQLTQIKHSPTGKTSEITIAVKQVSPEWAGGVAFGETGTLVGIVAASDTRAARLVSAETVRVAAARVLARRASVPQPWLGARGVSVETTPLEQFVARGWPLLAARALWDRRQGVLLTDVAPDTPAALAGLRPGDVVARISQREVRGIEDMSSLLQELGSNKVASFTVLRAQAPPLDLAVRLSEARNPQLETARAEARAAEAEMHLAESAARLAQAEMRVAEIEVRRIETELRACEVAARQTDAAHRAEAAQHLRAAQEHVRAAQLHVAEAQARMRAANVRAAESHQRRIDAEVRIQAASVAHFGLPAPQLLLYGLEAIQTWPADAANFSTPPDLLVVAVRPRSAAARAGMQTGDIIETIDGRRTNGASIEQPDNVETSLTLGVVRKGQKLAIKLPREPGN